jgi:hypothetical protein
MTAQAQVGDTEMGLLGMFAAVVALPQHRRGDGCGRTDAAGSKSADAPT